METFYQSFGEKVNKDIFKVFFFFPENVNHAKAKEIGESLNFTMFSKLRKYVRIPFHHKRFSKDSFNFILDKVSQRLDYWKAKTFSLVRSTTLTKSMFMPIP